MTLQEIRDFCAAGGFVAMVGTRFSGVEVRRQMLQVDRDRVIHLNHRVELERLIHVPAEKLRFMEVGSVGSGMESLLRAADDYARREGVSWVSLYCIEEEIRLRNAEHVPIQAA